MVWNESQSVTLNSNKNKIWERNWGKPVFSNKRKEYQLYDVGRQAPVWLFEAVTKQLVKRSRLTSRLNIWSYTSFSCSLRYEAAFPSSFQNHFERKWMRKQEVYLNKQTHKARKKKTAPGEGSRCCPSVWARLLYFVFLDKFSCSCQFSWSSFYGSASHSPKEKKEIKNTNTINLKV